MCGLAVAVDCIGDRWTLLIVRELLIQPRSFSELQSYLPGCSPNLLVSRLKEMTQMDLVFQKEAGNKKRGFYQLTRTGLSLREVVESLVRWGGELIPKQRGLSEKNPHWLEVAVPAILRPKLNQGSRYKIQFMIDDHEFAVSANNYDLDVIRGKSENPEITLKVPYEKLLAVMSGYLPLKSLTQNEIESKLDSSRATALKRLQEILL
jgi:DNA-binding HxlR family transcriptional regulator